MSEKHFKKRVQRVAIALCRHSKRCFGAYRLADDLMYWAKRDLVVAEALYGEAVRELARLN